MIKKYSYKDITSWFLSKESMTPKKLQKLTYYAEAWSYALFGNGILKDTSFQAWIHRPVSPELFEDYKDYGWNKIPQKTFNDEIFDEDVLNLLGSVWHTYGDRGGFELECLSHSEEPWIKARNSLPEFERSTKLIDPEDMKRFYKSIYIGD
uniref:Antitoxin SocA-like Panacea domain-containing protein n=1 Tax=Mycoplasma feriruminatoris TaxID=1179777 RepID=A0A654II32_9MOLU|nr:hypothetical protein MF5295_00491 [Mycoplasma feriruminatoris]